MYFNPFSEPACSILMVSILNCCLTHIDLCRLTCRGNVEVRVPSTQPFRFHPYVWLSDSIGR